MDNKVVIMFGTEEKEVHDVYMHLSNSQYDVSFNKMHRRSLAFNITAAKERRDDAMNEAIEYCAKKNYDEIIAVGTHCQKIKDIIADRTNNL